MDHQDWTHTIGVSRIFEIFTPYALLLSVFLCTLEVVIGVALLMNYKIKIVSKITLGLILFFTLKKIWEFYLFPNSHNMGAKFLSYTLDDPLSVSTGNYLAFMFCINI